MRFFLFSILFSTGIYAQVEDEYYKSFSSGQTGDHSIYFLNDSVVRFRNIMTHMSGSMQISGKYKKRNDTIYIEIPRLNYTDSIEASKYRLAYLSNKKIKLIVHKTELLDRSNDRVYVKSDICYSRYVRRKSIVLINGKKYKYDCGLTNGYGLIESMPRKNRRLIAAAKEVSKNPDRYITKNYGIVEGYERFGILGINGVVEIYKKTDG